MGPSSSPPASTPSFIFTSCTSPLDFSPQAVIPSTSTVPKNELPNAIYLPSRKPALEDEELASNAPVPLSPRSRSTIPHSMKHSLSTSGYEGENAAGNASSESHSLRSGTYEGEASERARVVRGRTLRPNNLHQRVYHQDELSLLPYPSDNLSSQQSETSSDSAEKGTLSYASPQAPSPSKSRFRANRSINPLRKLRPNGLIRRIRSLPDSPPVWLALYFLLNLTLTLYNKSVLIHFPFPYTLTALHALCGTIGTFILLHMDPGPGSARTSARVLTSVSPLHHNAVPTLKGKELVVLFLFSILYTLNIVVSNASLRLVTVPFHQVVRASAPFFTIIFSALLLGRRCSKEKLLSLVPVVAGVGFATYGDYYFTALGFFLTLLGTLLAALKTILTNIILIKPTASALPVSSDSGPPPQVETRGNTSSFPSSFFSSLVTLAVNRVIPPSPTSSPTYPTKPLAKVPPLSASAFALPKLSLSPLHLLYLLSPLAFIQTTLLAHFTGELDRVRWHLFQSAAAASAPGGSPISSGRMWLLLNGVLAFFLNVVSFNANRRVGPLGMSVAANVKQVLTILCAVAIFDLTITPANGLGIVLTLIGGALYAAVELREKQATKRRIG